MFESTASLDLDWATRRTEERSEEQEQGVWLALSQVEEEEEESHRGDRRHFGDYEYSTCPYKYMHDGLIT